jgi:hypothetical protein
VRLAGKEEGRSSGDQLCAWRACPQVARDLPHHFKKHRIDLSLCGHLLRPKPRTEVHIMLVRRILEGRWSGFYRRRRL